MHSLSLHNTKTCIKDEHDDLAAAISMHYTLTTARLKYVNLECVYASERERALAYATNNNRLDAANLLDGCANYLQNNLFIGCMHRNIQARFSDKLAEGHYG